MTDPTAPLTGGVQTYPPSGIAIRLLSGSGTGSPIEPLVVPNQNRAGCRTGTSCQVGETHSRCRPWKAKRRPVVPGRRRRGRLAGVAEGRSPAAAEARCKRIRSAVKPFDGGPWRSPTAPLGARRDGAVARSGANRGTRVVAERKAKGGLDVPFRILSTATLRPNNGPSRSSSSPCGWRSGYSCPMRK